jgi:hypothetical protein
VSAAVNRLVFLDAMSNYPAPTMGARWSQGMNCTFKAVEDVFFPANPDFESFVIVISASFTFGHIAISSA